jgi:RNA 2',3'-cyclic 3'-phosphodiesterase
VRLFVAILPPAEVTAELARQVAAVRPAWPGLRWTGPESWHVTVAFLGEVADGVLPELSVRLERAARRHAAPELAVRGSGAFPQAARARTVVAGIEAADAAGLAGLAASVAAGARRAGAPPPDEARRYRPHLTLAWLREPGDVRALTDELAGLASARWTAGQIDLMVSHPPAGPAGSRPRYESIASWPTRGPG